MGKSVADAARNGPPTAYRKAVRESSDKYDHNGLAAPKRRSGGKKNLSLCAPCTLPYGVEISDVLVLYAETLEVRGNGNFLLSRRYGAFPCCLQSPTEN